MKNRIYQSLLCLILLGNLGGVSVTALESNTYGQANFSETSLSTDSEKLVDGTSSSLDSTIDLESQVTPDSQPIKEGIIQSDDQVLIRNTTVDPYRKIVSLESYFSIGSGFGTSPTITASSTAAFSITVGAGGASSGVITLPTAANGWIIQGWDITQGTALFLQQTAFTATSATIGCFGITTGTSANLNAGDVIIFSATAF